jgi:hypothetical protein
MFWQIILTFLLLQPKQIWQGDKCNFSHDTVPSTKSKVLIIFEFYSLLLFSGLNMFIVLSNMRPFSFSPCLFLFFYPCKYITFYVWSLIFGCIRRPKIKYSTLLQTLIPTWTIFKQRKTEHQGPKVKSCIFVRIKQNFKGLKPKKGIFFKDQKHI